MPAKRKWRKKASLKRNIVGATIVLAIIVLGYVYIADLETKETTVNGNLVSNEPYQIVENTDSANYIAIIMIEKNTNILEISKAFYGNEVFWPYIFQKNISIENVLDLNKGSVIRIPHVEASLLDVNNKENVRSIKKLGDSLLLEITKKKEEALKPKDFF